MDPKKISKIAIMRNEIVEKFAILITGAFGLVSALAWNSAIQKWFESRPALAAGGPFFYAVLVTILAVAMTLWIGWIAGKAKKSS